MNITPEQGLIAALALAAAIGITAALLRRDDASEIRRKKYIKLAGKLRSRKFTFVADFLECLAVKDYDGAIGVAESALNSMEDDKTAAAHFREIFEMMLQNPAYADEIVKRAEQIQTLKAAEAVKTTQKQQVGNVVVQNETVDKKEEAEKAPVAAA